jgi:altronate hydrolase
MSKKVLKVHPGDNVVVALQDIAKGESITYNGNTYKIADDIPAKHKFFEKDMNTGDEVIMYGVLVGKAQNAIPSGGLMDNK